MSDTIRPTPEQREAAAKFYGVTDPCDAAGDPRLHDLADLLAMREASLREENAFLAALLRTVAPEVNVREVREADRCLVSKLRAEIKTLRGFLDVREQVKP